jgi:CheY-like chemotaxis protein
LPLLTLTQETSERDSSGPTIYSPGAALKRILVIEDNRDAADSLKDLLELSGYEVEVAYTGPTGVETARLFQPEMVICDVGLPGMDGYAVAAELRKDEAMKASQLIAVSGYGREEDRRRAREAGFDAHLTKPVAPEVLQRLLSQLE